MLGKPVAVIVRWLTRWRQVAVLAAIAVGWLAGTALWGRSSVDPALVATAVRGDLTATVSTSGTLRPSASITYRSPLPGREVEIKELVAEGTRVKTGDVLIRFETAELDVERARADQEFRQAQIDFQAAAGEWEEAAADVKAVSEGEGALSVEEAQAARQRAEKKVERLREEVGRLKPLLDKGFMTREELAKTSDQLEEAEEGLALTRKRADVLVQLTHPREQKRAVVQLAQKESQLAHARTRVQETELRVDAFRQVIDACTVYAKSPGLVVYEEFLSASPRRKIRVSDRVYASQGVITIPEVSRMRVETSVSESDVHRVTPGQPVTVRVEAFPNLMLTGKVSRVGTLAGSSINRPFEDKRFDVTVDLDATTAELRPEMTARADIVVGNSQGVVLVPVTAVFDRQGTFVTYIVGPTGRAERRQVQLGASNGQQVQIAAGVEAGERVMLVEPPGAASEAPAPFATAAPRGNVLQPR